LETAIPFNFKVLLEGVNVPFLSAVVSVALDGPAQASISLASTAALTMLKAKTLVHIFFRVESTGGSPDPNWYLLFEGEVSGDSPSRDPSSRSYAIRAEGLTNNWFRCKLYMIKGDGPVGGDAETAKSVGTASPDQANVYVIESKWTDYSEFVQGNAGEPLNPGATYKSLLARIEGVNDYFKGLQTRLKIKERVYAAQDSELSELVKSKLFFEQVFNAEAGASLSTVAPVMQLINVLTEMTYYEWVEVVAPSRMDRQIIFKPKLYFAPPPCCNVLFPGRYTTQSGDRDFMAEPTRLIATLESSLDTTPGGDGVSTTYYYSPRELSEAVDAILGKFSSGSDGRKLQAALKELNNTFLTEEEKNKGIVDAYVNFSAAEWSVFNTAKGATAEGKPDKDAQHKYIQHITDFKFATQRFQNRSKSYGAAFNPYHVVGFPFLALSSAGNSLGLLESISHTFSPNGGGTSLTVAYNREIGVRFKGAAGRSRAFSAERFAFPDNPPWLNKDYLSGSVYPDVIGSPAVSEFSAAALSARAFELYDQVTDDPEHAQAFSLQFNKRPLVTERAYMDFVGVTGSAVAVDAAAAAAGAAVDNVTATVAAAEKVFGSAASTSADTAAAAATITAAKAAKSKADDAVRAALTANAAFNAQGDVPVYSGGPFRKAHQGVILEHINIVGGSDALEGF